MPQLSATLDLAINTFVPIDQGSISYKMALITNYPKVFTLSSPVPTYTLTVSPPDKCEGAELIFSLPDPAYVLIGIYFVGAGKQAPIGREEFRTITINRSFQSSTMSVSDACAPEDYTYAILVQQASTGLLGIIDPRIVMDPEPPAGP